VRAALTPFQRTEIFRRIEGHTVPSCPFVNLPNSKGSSRWEERISADDMRTLRWVKPRQVVEVAFVEWTLDGLLRHPAFVGLRDDKKPASVRREAAV
jgi:ATP-dependent DNA ligase